MPIIIIFRIKTFPKIWYSLVFFSNFKWSQVLSFGIPKVDTNPPASTVSARRIRSTEPSHLNKYLGSLVCNKQCNIVALSKNGGMPIRYAPIQNNLTGKLHPANDDNHWIARRLRGSRLSVVVEAHGMAMGTAVVDHGHVPRPRICVEAAIHCKLVVVLTETWRCLEVSTKGDQGPRAHVGRP